jgi:hypothetical protein
MLARTPYLTAQELGIREIEHEYLSRFVSEGEQGKLPERHRFDMGCAFGKNHCGTIGCIAGTMQLYAVLDGRLQELTECGSYMGPRGSVLRDELFYGQGYCARAGLPQAVSCTKHFLQTGTVDWPLALGVSS